MTVAASDRRGAVIVEFAMVALPFVALMLAMLQTSLIYFIQEGLETTAESTARLVITGKAQASDSAGVTSGMSKSQLQERFRKSSCAVLPSYMSCARLVVDVRSATTWAALDSSLPALTYDPAGKINSPMSYDLGGQGSVVIIRFLYVWPVVAGPLLRLTNAPNGQRLLVATSVAKSESFQ